jgi:phage terminase Nu1 subunit (DNA packaging protein)
MMISGQDGLADLFGVSRITVQEWHGRPGFPVAYTGAAFDAYEYDSAAVVGWYVAWKSSERGESPNDRLARVRADAIEMDNAERRGQLIPADLLEPKLAAAFVAAREAWLDAVPRLARDLPADADQRETMLLAEFEAFLSRLADWAKAGDVDDD